ncbi:MAG: recombinase family protein [Firmicutes bacterium]|nr:recombinase family protein [Bacillota bacterium]
MEQQGYNYNNYYNGLTTPPEFYSVALYTRFSRDDGQSADNSSIETQKMMLEKYCKDNGYKVYDTYVDDGYTGLNFDRPAFQKMLEDIDANKVNMVITKDLSRLGRDYIQMGHFVEIVFSNKDVRYIAINDSVDTAKSESTEFMPFRNIFNNMYSRDISRKTKSAIRQRALNGLFTSSYAPYGYNKNPNNPSKLIIDEEAAGVVKQMFSLVLEGKGKRKIANILTANRVLIPSAYKTKQGAKGYVRRVDLKPNSEYIWRYTTVKSILSNRLYTGDMVGGKTEIINYKTGRAVSIPKERHIIVPNTHEPIINRDDFDRVQQLIATKHMPPKNIAENIFRGLIVCAGCGRRMNLSYMSIKSKGKTINKRPLCRCKNVSNSLIDCKKYNYIYHDDLSAQILVVLRRVFNLVKDDDKVIEIARKKIAKDNSRDKQLIDKSKIEKRLTTLTAVIRKLYEDYVIGMLSVDNYQDLLRGYQAEQKELMDKLSVITAELDKITDYESGIKKLKTIADNYANITELTAEMLNKLICRIEIGYPEKQDGKITQEISIIYNFIKSTL